MSNQELQLIPKFMQSYHEMQLLTVHECISSIAHEVNQPLSATVNYIHGCLHYLKDRDIPADVLDALEQAASQAERAGNMAHQLKQFYSDVVLQRVNIDINNLVRNLINNIEHELSSHKIKTHLLLGDRAQMVPCFIAQLAQGLLCFILNAVEAMADVAEGQRDLTISTTANAQTKRLTLAITDTGSGVNKENRDKIFKSFFTTKVGHAGVGLSIAHYIVEMHQGQLLLDETTELTTFKLILPMEL